ncbi:MAG: hypothetical protein ABSF53_21485 [Terracidiphilus sp.]|jgi:hypothetical protein
MVPLDTILWLAGDGATAAVAILLLRKGTFRTFPLFSSYLLWSLLSDLALFAVGHFDPAFYYNAYSISNAIDSLFQFGVLVELSWAVLRPLRGSLPRWTLLAIAILILLVGAAVWPLAAGWGLGSLSLAGQVNVHVQETFSVLRILFFLLLAGCSQLLSIGWRDRELQIATGLGFYSLVSLAVWMQHRTGPQYHALDQLVAASYICSLAYWAYSFAQQEAQRREFTPQMESFLLAVAGNARSTRLAMKNPPQDEAPQKRK